MAIEPREGALTERSATLTGFATEHSLGLTRFAFLLTGDRQLAEDLVQEAFLALYRRFGEDLPVAAPVAYARKVILNAQLSRARRRSVVEVSTDAIPEGSVSGDGPNDAAWQAMAGLPERQRAVLVLRYYLDQPDGEIARVLGCRPGTVRSLATRAFAVMRVDPALSGLTRREQRP